MFSSLVTNIVSYILVSAVIDFAIFNIIYSTINSGVKYLKNVIIYVIGMELKLIIMTGIASFGMFLLSLGIYLVVGLILIWILQKIYDYFPRISFVVVSIVLQAGITWVLEQLL